MKHKRTLFAERVIDHVLDDRPEWCEATIELRENQDGLEVLSICGSYGYVLSREEAAEEALQYWESFFDESDSERLRMIENAGEYMTSKQMAEKVVESDGEYHGLDVHKVEEDNVYTLTGCGQVRDEIASYFPEVVQYFKYHMNDMHSGCIHQDARGETWEKNPEAVCPDCNWVLGSGWTYRPLPAEVREWALGLTTAVTDPFHDARQYGLGKAPKANYFPIRIRYNSGEELVVAKPEDIQSGKQFNVLETNVSETASDGCAVCTKCGFENKYMDRTPNYICGPCRS